MNELQDKLKTILDDIRIVVDTLGDDTTENALEDLRDALANHGDPREALKALDAALAKESPATVALDIMEGDETLYEKMTAAIDLVDGLLGNSDTMLGMIFKKGADGTPLDECDELGEVIADLLGDDAKKVGPLLKGLIRNVDSKEIDDLILHDDDEAVIEAALGVDLATYLPKVYREGGWKTKAAFSALVEAIPTEALQAEGWVKLGAL